MRFNKAKSKADGNASASFVVSGLAKGERLARELRGNRFAADDLNDALAALWSARRIAAGDAKPFPEETQWDSKGLQMRIEA